MEGSEPFTDPEKMKVLFQQQLPGYSQGRYLITQCRVLRVQFQRDLNEGSPGIGFFALRYQLEVIDISNGNGSEEILFAKVYPEGRRREEFRNRTQARFGNALAYLPHLGMMIWAFPNDPGISQLPEIMDPHKIKNYLPYEFLPPGIDGPQDITDIKLNVVRYHPGIRCTFRLSYKRKSSEQPLSSYSLYGKTFNDDQGKDLYQIIRNLWMLSLKDPDGFIIAQPFAYHVAVKILWQKTLEGKSLGTVVDRTNCERFLGSVGRDLACLHASSCSDFSREVTFDRLNDILDRIDDLMNGLPQLRESLESIISSIQEGLPRLTPISNRPVHGSFRIKEVLVCENGLGVFDLDKVSVGDWVRDLALFLVDLSNIYRDSTLLDLMSTSFYHAYCLKADWELPVDRLKWHIQVQYLKRACWLFKNKRLDPKLEKRIHRVITLAQKGIALGDTT